MIFLDEAFEPGIILLFWALKDDLSMLEKNIKLFFAGVLRYFLSPISIFTHLHRNEKNFSFWKIAYIFENPVSVWGFLRLIFVESSLKCVCLLKFYMYNINVRVECLVNFSPLIYFFKLSYDIVSWIVCFVLDYIQYLEW